jgi:hypothetical protein
MPQEKSIEFFEEKHRETIRKAFRAGKRTIELSGIKFNLEQAKGRGGKPFILILPVNGQFPMGQIEKERFGSSKLKDKEGNKLLGVARRRKGK